MSSPLAIAAVTAILKDLLNEGLINNDLAAVGSFSVTATPPDRITTGDTEPNRLNWFLYQVAPNPGWRNAGLPSFGSQGGRLTNPPLALDLHYLLTAYGSADLNAEILLGYAMELMHDTPVLTPNTIRRSLAPNNPVSVALVPQDPQGRTAIDLADQLELVKITPHYLSADELAKMWTAMQARYRPSMAYQVSTVLIRGRRPVAAALPVLARGRDDRGVLSQPDTARPVGSLPAVNDVAIVAGDGSGPRSSAELGDTLKLTGDLIGGTTVTAEFRHRLLTTPLEVVCDAASTAALAIIRLPAANFGSTANDWPAGAYLVSLRIEVTGKVTRRTRPLAIDLAPRVKPAPVVTAGAAGALDLTVQCEPALWPQQTIDVLVGADGFQPDPPIAAKVSTLTLSVARAARADVPVPVRLVVDGVASNAVRDRSLQPPQFDPQQTVSLPL